MSCVSNRCRQRRGEICRSATTCQLHPLVLCLTPRRAPLPRRRLEEDENREQAARTVSATVSRLVQRCLPLSSFRRAAAHQKQLQTLDAFTAVLSHVFCPCPAAPLDCTFLALAPPLPLYPSPHKYSNLPFAFILLPSPHPIFHQPFVNSSKHPFFPRVSLPHHPPLFVRLHPTTTTWVSPLPSSLFPRITHLHSFVSLYPG
jgi:hypothetical protein